MIRGDNMGMAFNNLKTLKLRELKGSQFAGVGNVFSDISSKSDFAQIALIKNAVIDALSFTGGLPFPDGLKLADQTANANTKYFYPETFFDTETDSNSFMIELMGVSCTVGSGDTASVALMLEDGNNSLFLQKPTNVTLSGPLIYTPSHPIYLNKNLYLSVANQSSVDCTIVVYAALVSRGGNPQ